MEKSPTGPTGPLDQQFTLAPGQTTPVNGTSLRVLFMRVSGDSRCPADVVCVWAGDALVHIRAIDGGPAEYELHAGDRSRSAVTHAGIRITLEGLQPYPFSTQPIHPDDYRATLRASR